MAEQPRKRPAKKPAAEKPAAPPPPGAGGYDDLKERARARNAALSRRGRDIAPLPPVADPALRAEVLGSLEAFLTKCFPETFSLPFSPDHLKVITALETAARSGGLFAFAMPRGSGKTSLCERAAIWCAVQGLREFTALIGAEEAAAEEMLAAIKTELETNDRLLALFPEVCYPIRRMEGGAVLAVRQLLDGERTRMTWGKKTVVLATVPGSAASGSIIKVAGLTGRIRGMKHQRADGRSVRPSLVILDDPQTDASAASLPMSVKRERILAGAILGLAGPGKKIAAVCPCTVIRPGDMADNLLDPQRHPEWQGERMKALYSFPADTAWWEKYAEIYKTCLRDKKPIAAATDLYLRDRRQADAAAIAAWPERFNEDEASAIQHCMNRRIQDEEAFMAEYQQEPLIDQLGDAEQLAAEQVLAKLNGFTHGRVPIDCHTLTAFVDVHDALLYWMVCAWGDGFLGAVIDYGAHPDQQRRYFTLRDARPTLKDLAPGQSKQAAILAGLQTLVADLMNHEYPREGGQVLRVRLALVDAGYVPAVVQTAIRTSQYASMLLASTGQAIGAKNRPLSEYIQKPGDRAGHEWRIPSVAGRRLIPTVQPNVNYWKSRVRDFLQASLAENRASLSVWGKDANTHRLLADHLTAEYFTRVEARGRTVEEWQPRPNHRDNHFLDCAVGCLVAASVAGVKLAAAEPDETPRLTPSQRPSLADLARRKG